MRFHVAEAMLDVFAWDDYMEAGGRLTPQQYSYAWLAWAVVAGAVDWLERQGVRL